jgi:RNA polymerase sigma-70 factor, ECF subfamily
VPTFPSTIWQDLDRARNGEAAAWATVVTRYRPAIHAFLRSAGRSEADAEDISQDVFLQMVRSRLLDGAHPRHGRFRSLVLAITTNVMRHKLRDDRAEKRGGGKQPVSLEGQDAPAPEDEERFDQEWVKRMIASALDELSKTRPAYHQALRLSLENRTQAQIAEALGKSAAQVNNHVHRARMWMQRRLKELVRESCADADTYREELAWLGKYVDLEGK